MADDRILTCYWRTLRPGSAVTAFIVVLGAAILSFVTIQQFFQTFQNNSTPQWKVSKPLGAEDQANPPLSFDDGDSGVGWEQIKKLLCPQGVPNKAICSKLFALASLAMKNSTKYEHLYNFLQQDQNMAPRFYHGFFDDTDVYVDEVSTLVYVRIFKCGNNFIRGWLGEAAKELSRNQDMHWGESGARAVKRVLANDERRPYCIITAVRDPISHFLSGYNEMEFRVWNGQNAKNEARGPPAYYLSLPYTTPIKREERFTQFVLDILDERRDRFDGLEPIHVFSMSRVLSALSDYNLTLTAVLPSIQNLTSRFPEFIRTACPHFPPIPETFHVNDSLGEHESSSDPAGFYAAAKSVWSRQGRVAKALCIIHAMDYACWDNLPDGIPPLCQMVYGEYLFVKIVLSGKRPH